MSKDSIRLSPKHGVNPSLSVCFFCGEDKNEIVLPGLIRDRNEYGRGQFDSDVKAPHRAVWDKEPCDKCKGYMEQGIILISVRDGEDNKVGNDNPYRSGKFAVIKEEAIRRMVRPQALADDICKRRVAFIPDAVWTALGLSGDKNEQTTNEPTE